MIVFLIFLLCLAFLCESSAFISSRIYYDSLCISDSFSADWIFPVSNSTTNCTKRPFGIYSRYIHTENKIKRITYNETNCGINSIDVQLFDLNVCSLIHIENGLKWYVNFSVVDFLPFDRSASKKWFVQDNFKDSTCQRPFDFIDDRMKISSTTFSIYNDPSLLRENLYDRPDYSTLFFCTNEWIAEEYYYLPNFTTIECWKFFPNGVSNQCISRYNDTLYTMDKDLPFESTIHSIIPHCLTETEFQTEYVDKLPTLDNYEFRYWFFEKNCSEYFKVQLWSMGHCIEEMFSFITLDDGYSELGYRQSGCNGGLYYLRIITERENGPGYYGDCVFRQDDPIDEKIPNYIIGGKNNDPYLSKGYSQLARVRTSLVECGGDLNTIKINPGSASVRTFVYLRDGRCTKIYGEDDDDINDKLSVEAECNEGKLSLRKYTQSIQCYGYYIEERNIDSWCYQDEEEYYHHFTCFPKVCGEIFEYDDNVCNSRGKCIGLDKCDCEIGYSGNLCQTFQCFDVDYDDEEGKVCNGNGKCEGPDNCVCKTSFYGKECQHSSFVIFGSVAGGILAPVFIMGISCVVCCCWLCCCAAIFLVFCIISLFVFSVIASSLSVKQRKSLKRFHRLKDFDLLLHEQLLDEEEGQARFKINKKLFQVQYEELNLQKAIGSGGSESTVYLVDWKGQEVAFKSFKSSSICRNRETFDEFERELEILSSVSHPNIVRFFGAVLKPPRIGILMEFCENGDMCVFLTKNKDYPMDEKIRWATEICSAMTYLHERNILHRDLKLENVLLASDESCKVMDFGLSRMVEGMSQQKTKKIGTSIYMSPEIYTDARYDEKTDVYSFAIMLYILFSLQFKPYGKVETGIEIKVANDPTFRPKLNHLDNKLGEEYHWISEIVVLCWDHDSSKRYGFNQLLDMFTKREVREKSLSKNRHSSSSKKLSRKGSLSWSMRRKIIEAGGDNGEEILKLRDDVEKYKESSEKYRQEVLVLKQQIEIMKLKEK